MTRQTIQTDKAPAAVGTYSQAVKLATPFIFQVSLVLTLKPWN